MDKRSGTISLCMIVRDEQDVLERCLLSAAPAVDEIIIVDTGSADNTGQIALRYTDKVFDFEWQDDFAAARNYSFSKASSDYIMWLDADDVLSKEAADEINALKNSGKMNADIYMMKYNVAFDKGGKAVFGYYRERLLKRSRGFLWQGRIHEAVELNGSIEYLNSAVEHRKLKAGDPDRNLRIFRKMESSGEKFAPREKFYFGRELYYHGLKAEAIKMLGEFLDDGGRKEDMIAACLDLSRCRDNDTLSLRDLFSSFLYDAPHAEICCEIGLIKFRQGRYSEAIFWYKAAVQRQPDEKDCGFVNYDCCGYIPYMQLCVCYDRLGDRDTACYYNELAGAQKPYDENYLANRKYFERNSI